MLVLLFFPYFFKSSAEFAYSKSVLARFTFFPISYHLTGERFIWALSVEHM